MVYSREIDKIVYDILGPERYVGEFNKERSAIQAGIELCAEIAENYDALKEYHEGRLLSPEDAHWGIADAIRAIARGPNE